LEALESSEARLEKIGYNYNSLSEEQAKRLLDVVLKNKALKRFDIKGNEFRSKTKKYYKDGIKEAGVELDVLSKFESDSSFISCNLTCSCTET